MGIERLLYRIPVLLRSILRRAEVDRELDEELQFHLDRHVEQLISNGMAPAEAADVARRAFGGVEQQKEACRDARRTRPLEDAVRDVAYAVRVLRRTPAFTLVAVVSLALGIGANTAIFSVVNAVLLRPLAYGSPERLVLISQAGADTVAPANVLDWRARTRTFDAFGAAEFWNVNITGLERSEQVQALRLTADVLPMLGVRPLLGRLFTAEEAHAGADRVVVASHALWVSRLGGDPQAIGRTLTLDGVPYTVVGVMPQEFRFAPFWATRAQLWAPLVLDARAADRNGASLRSFARLRKGVTLEQARADIATIASTLERQYPGTNRDVIVTPLQDRVVGSVRRPLVIVFAAVVLVLLIACVNVAHLQLVRGAARRREIALRAAIGASRGRVVRQLLAESMVLSACGGLLGVGFALAGVRLLLSWAPADLPRLDTVSVNAGVLAFAAATSLVAGIVFGIMPALRTSRVNVHDSLKQGARTSDGTHAGRLRNLLVVSEFAMALILLTAAGLVVRSFIAMLRVDSGFDPASVVAMEVSVTGSAEAAPGRREAFFRELLDRLKAAPPVDAVSAINHLPLAGDTWRFPFAVQGRPPAEPGRSPFATYRVVMPGYFRTMRIPILAGRDFTFQDVVDTPHVVIINDVMARRHFPGGEEPIGRHLTFDDVHKNPDWWTIVGVSKAVKQSAWTDEETEEMYFPFLQSRMYLEQRASFASYMTVVMRGTGSPGALLETAEAIVRTMDRDVTVAHKTTMQRAIAEQFVEPRFYLVLLGSFAALASVLAAVGLYGVMSYSVARRTHEIGVRLALGARPAALQRLVLGQAVRLTVIGALIGSFCAVAAMPYMRALLFGIEPFDAGTFVAGLVTLGGVALAAGYFPARRASHVDPLTALRSE